MIVSRADLERSLARLAGEVRDPRAGIHGPHTVSWRLNREAVNFLGAGRAALLQLAHPFVAHAVDQHSAARTDARGRFQRTFENVFAMTFGDLDQALGAARRVHAVHSRIRGVLDADAGVYPRGTRYRANDSSSLFWVHATLVDSVLAVRDALGFRLSPAEREEYYQESRRFARLFGIPDDEVPPDSLRFRAYMDERLASCALEVTRPAREIAGFLFAAPTPALRPLAGWYRAVTAALLPPRFRAPFGLRYGAVERLVAASSLRAIARLYPATPAALRFLPGYLSAMQRVGAARRAPLGRSAVRAAGRALSLWPEPA